MKRILPLILCLSLLLGCFSGCAAEDTPYIPTGDAMAPEGADLNATESDEDEEPQEFSLAYYPSRSMNPLASTDYTNRTLFSLMYQGLFSIDRNCRAVPVLCENYRVSSDNRTFTFFICDAKFSDGTKVTIDDVLASYETALKSTYFKGRFLHTVRSVELSDDGGISFRLSTPMEDLPLLLDVPIVKASEVEAEFPLGTGPYVLDQGVTGAYLRRNPGWWCAESAQGLVVKALSIPLVGVEATTEIRDEFEFSDVGVVCADPCSDTYADYRCDYELWEVDNGVFLYLGVNLAYSQDDIFQNQSFRSSLTYAIDRQKLVEENYGDFARATTIPVSPRSPYYSAGLAAKYEYDPVRFIEALGHVKLPKEPLRLLVNQDDALRLRTARDIANMLRECGLEVEVVEKETKEYRQYYINGKYDLYLGLTRLSTTMDLSAFFHPYGEMSRNGTADSVIYELCLDALENSGNYYNLHKAVADDGRLIPILFGSYAVYADRGLVTDLQPSRDNVFFYTLGRTDSDALIPIDYGESVG